LEGKTLADLELTEKKQRTINYYNWQTERRKTAPNKELRQKTSDL
jgi:hypothetical protein